ncbi:MAG: hypothetical protein ACI8T1_003707 [Verrucomicrobiales bacterium]|jgi:hypothetical protein
MRNRAHLDASKDRFMNLLGTHFESVILDVTKASQLGKPKVIQELWSGYGKILRMPLIGGDVDSVVLKYVQLPIRSSHPRGWNSNLSHERKVRSYEIETTWYRDWSARCDNRCRIPQLLALERHGDDVLMVLEDLDLSGFPSRLGKVKWRQVEISLKWLANFHATFMDEKPEGLWEIGTYWHLDTRPDELEALEDSDLREAASEIDLRLKLSQHQTLVHGDAKLANFCFSKDGDRVAVVDFQYVGGGCGMKDVAYFVGSCLDEQASEDQEPSVLDTYFTALRHALARHQPSMNANAVIAEWRELYHVAWTDFHRFLKGWSPGHWKINSYSERLATEVIAKINRA